jgi:hypothetical protein
MVVLVLAVVVVTPMVVVVTPTVVVVVPPPPPPPLSSSQPTVPNATNRLTATAAALRMNVVIPENSFSQFDRLPVDFKSGVGGS